MNLQDDLEQRSTITPDGKENGYSLMTPTLGPNKNTRKLSYVLRVTQRLLS